MSRLEVASIVNTILQSCTYIVFKENDPDAYLVDCGDPIPIIEYLEKNNKQLKGVFLTHSHYDHIYGLHVIIKRYPRLTVYASEQTLTGLNDSDMNMSYLYTDEEYRIMVKKSNSYVVDNNTRTRVLGEPVVCIRTPGHDLDCISYVIGNAIFTGDAYNPNSPVYTRWHNSNEAMAKRSEDLLRQMISERELDVYPGHLIEY